MFCSNCGKELPEGTKFCGFCGTAVKAEEPETQEPAKAEEPVKAEDPVKAQEPAKAEEPIKAEEPVVTPEPVAVQPAYEEPKPTYSPIPEEPAEKKKGKGGKIAAIVLSCVALIAVIIGGCLFFAKDKLGNTIHKTFDKPKDYYSYVEKKNLSNLSEKSGAEYATKVLDQMKTDNRTITETIKVKVGPRGKDFTALASTAGIDLSWLDSVGLTYVVGAQDSKFKLSMSPILNDTKLATVLMLMDFKEGKIIGSVPELTDKYLGLSLGDSAQFEDSAEQFEKIFGIYEEMAKAIPSPEKLEEMALKYYEIVMEQVETMEKSKSKLEVDDVSEECTLLTMELSSKELQKILKSLTKELSKDKDVEKIFMDLYDSMSEIDESISGEKMYEDFQKSLEKLDQSIEDVEIEKFIMETYVNKEGEIVGRTVTIKANGESVTVIYANPRKDDNVGLELSVKASKEETSFSLTAVGKEKDGKYNGDMKLKVGDKKVATCSIEDYDVEEAKKGNFSGNITIKPGSDVDLNDLIRSVFGRSASDNQIVSMLGNMDLALKLSGEMKLEQHDVTLSVLDGGSEIVSLIFTGTIGEGESISLPENYIEISQNGSYDEAELKDFVKNLNFDVVFDNLRTAKLPEEWIKMAELYIKQMMNQLR